MAHKNSTRSNANTSNISVSDNPCSGFDLSQKIKTSLRIGRRELVGYELTMPHDKIRTSIQHDLTINPTAGNQAPAMDIRFETTYVPFRCVNADFEDSLSFEKGVPWVSTNYPKTDCLTIIDWFFSNIFSGSVFDEQSFNDIATDPAVDYALLYQHIGNIANNFSSIFLAQNNYLQDYSTDLFNHLLKLISGYNDLDTNSKISCLRMVFYDIIKDFIGKGSYLDILNAPIVRPQWLFDVNDPYYIDDTTTLKASVFQNRNGMTTKIDLNILRALYADWFETTRDANLEPGRTMPRYNRWTNAVNSTEDIVCQMLAPRYCTFDKDMWTTASVGSPYRETFAPIIDATANISFDDDITEVGVKSQLEIRNNSTSNFVSAPVSGLYANTHTSASAPAFQLDLATLRMAKLQRAWAMRGHVFGDEYADNLLAQYGVKISDSRINKPELLIVTSKELGIDSVTAPVDTPQMPAGTKTCIYNAGGGSDSREFFTEEFGIVLYWAYIVPSVTYEPYDCRHMIMNGKQFPQPVLANQSEELSFIPELSRALCEQGDSMPFGRHLAYHPWRYRVNENHGDYLDTYRPYTFLRDFTYQYPALNSTFIHTHVNLDFMVDTDPMNTFAYGTISKNFFVQRELPVVTEVC